MPLVLILKVLRDQSPTLLWKSQCHHYLHEKLSQVKPSARLDAAYFQGFLLRDIGDYQSKAMSTGASNPGRREQGEPGIIRFKAYNCVKEQVSVNYVQQLQSFRAGIPASSRSQ